MVKRRKQKGVRGSIVIVGAISLLLLVTLMSSSYIKSGEVTVTPEISSDTTVVEEMVTTKKVVKQAKKKVEQVKPEKPVFKSASDWATRKNFIYTSPSGVQYEMILPSNKRCSKVEALTWLCVYLPYMAKDKDMNNIPLSLTAFQGWWESNFSNTSLGDVNNPFGMKARKGAKHVKKHDDFATKSKFGVFDSKYAALAEHARITKRIVQKINPKNPHIGDWTYKVYLWELQCDAHLCSKCGGKGCKKCGPDGIIGYTYATGKEVGKPSNPVAYYHKGLETIEAYQWYAFDKIYEKEGAAGIQKLVEWMKTRYNYVKDLK